MDPIILRDHDSARQYLLQGLWFQRVVPPSSGAVSRILEWALTIADAGNPLPPTGFIGDVGHAGLGMDRGASARKEMLAFLGLSALVRKYDDHVLGKIYADHSFERASDALKRIVPEKRTLGLAYIVTQIRERGGIGGVELSPGIIRGLLETSAKKPEELLRQGWEMLSRGEPMPLLIEQYQRIITAVQKMADLLGDEDVRALEQKTALLSMGEYVAHRQVWQMALQFEERLPKHKVKPLPSRREVPTRVLDEDTYPVGGFASISTRGSIESLLHSQLAFMEKEKELQPDLFDVRMLRDELYYYSRDENQFLRRRRTFVYVLAPDLVQARIKDADLPYQRIVLALALLLASVRKLSEWLNADALNFEFLLIPENEKNVLEDERKLLSLLFREEIENRSVSIDNVASSELESLMKQRSSRSACHCLLIGALGMGFESQNAVVAELRIGGQRPVLRMEPNAPVNMEEEEPLDCWQAALLRLLEAWI